MWYNEAGGEGTPVREKASKKLGILPGPRLALILPTAIAAGAVAAALWGPLRPGGRPGPRLLLFWACGALPILACFVWAPCCQAVMDARGVRARIPDIWVGRDCRTGVTFAQRGTFYAICFPHPRGL